jgi:glyoxylase-like metal-dependent hydrolase (beta-lactamase superfamily II)
MRSLLIDTGSRKILVDTGLGNKQSQKWQSFFYPKDDDIVVHLRHVGLSNMEITDVILTHLHFDHVGGALYIDDKGVIKPSFPVATYWVCDKHFRWAIDPNPREKPSFLKENFEPLHSMGLLKFIDYQDDNFEFIQGIKIRYANGHTEAMITLEIQTEQGLFYYPADLIPTHCHLADSYIMSYDVRPLVTMHEKKAYLTNVFQNDGTLIFEHDSNVVASKIVISESGNYILSNRNKENYY